MNNVIIRSIEESDLNSIAELYKLFWGDKQNIDKMKIKYRELRDNDKYVFLCASIDNHIVGTIMGIVCEELYGECRPFMIMDDLVVHNDFRKKKIGTILLTSLEKIGKEKGCYQILFMTEVNRTTSVSFYESMGYNSKTNVGFKKKLL